MGPASYEKTWPLTPPRSLRMNELFARRYQLLERIAIGGTAEVFRATFLMGDGEGRPVVIKRVLPQFARDERFRRLFHEEACVAVTISHPHIVKVLDYGAFGQTCYIALELVEGKDLGNLLSTARSLGQLPHPKLAAFIAARVAHALQFIHERTSSEGTPLRIIHRDVSPQNILVSFAGDVKLTDFGIAKSAIRQERTMDGALRGKLNYMAPEQAMLGDVDHRADIFALGCVLFEMVQGHPPFQGENELETLERVRSGKFSEPLANLAIHGNLVNILSSALCSERNARYPHAAQMALDLEAFYEGESEESLREQLKTWIHGLTRQTMDDFTRRATDSDESDRVGEAVKKLLGQAEEESTKTQGTMLGTTVFASHPSEHSFSSVPKTVSPKPATVQSSRRLTSHLFYLVIIILAVIGWLLWAQYAFKPEPSTNKAKLLSPARDVYQLAVTPPRLDLSFTANSASASQSAGDKISPTNLSRLTIHSIPSAALALINGAPIGVTPLHIPSPTTLARIELRKSGYRPWKKYWIPGQDRKQVTARLTLLPPPSEPGYLTINSLPWSRVYIDGKMISNTPLLKWPIKAGHHRIEIRSPDGVIRKAFSVTISSNKLSSYTFDFTKR